MRTCYRSNLRLLNNRALFDTAFDPMLFTRFIEAFQVRGLHSREGTLRFLDGSGERTAGRRHSL